jgi:hypothetical protein
MCIRLPTKDDPVRPTRLELRLSVGWFMGTGSNGVATVRHVGLVALEALLIATIVWIAAMTLAGATGSGGLVGDANAGKTIPSLTVTGAQRGGTLIVTATPGEAGMWVHATCTSAATVVLSAWVRIDAAHRAAVSLAPSATWRTGGAACVAEEGYFSSNGRWRVLATTTFTVTG